MIHGKADKLMRPFGGRAVAKAIRGARLVLFDGMGHELPAQLWDDIIGELYAALEAKLADFGARDSEPTWSGSCDQAMRPARTRGTQMNRMVVAVLED